MTCQQIFPINLDGTPSNPLAAPTDLPSGEFVLAPGSDPNGSPPARRQGKVVKIDAGGCGTGRTLMAAPDLTSLVTVADAARDLRISQRHLRRLIAVGQVRVVRFGRAVRIPRDEVERLAKDGLPLPKGPETGSL